MKLCFFSLLAVIFGVSDISLGLICLSSESNYQIILSDDFSSAEALKDLLPLRFGELVCSTPSAENDSRTKLICRSKNVADAGFSATFFTSESGTIESVKLSEIFFAGAKSIATLPCFDTMGTLEKRVLWLTGEGNVEKVDVAAGGEIEVNIKTTSGTGYQWELQNPPVPNSVTLVEGPSFISTHGLPGGVGVTRFRFRIDHHPNREFSLFFQLRRPWENAAIKKFSVRLNVGFI